MDMPNVVAVLLLSNVKVRQFASGMFDDVTPHVAILMRHDSDYR
jgi:hypothetical protein